MSYDEFIAEIRESLCEQYGGAVRISICEAIKNNGCVRRGLSFAEAGRNVSPTIYLEEYYEKYGGGAGMKQLAREIGQLYEQIRTDQFEEIGVMGDAGEVSKRIVCKLVNREKNAQLLSQVPCVEYLDLAVVFSVLVDVEESRGQLALMQVKNEHLDLWKMTKEQLYECAVRNTKHFFSHDFRPICSAIREMLPPGSETGSECPDVKEDLFVLTNRYRNCGAIVIHDPDVMERIGEKLGQNYFVLPSSIHEVIIVPESEALSAEEMLAVVREVNDSFVEKEEYLSDQVYYYNRETQMLTGTLPEGR